MSERTEFLNRLGKLKEYSDTEGRTLRQEEVLTFFEGMDLSPEQTGMIFEYIRARRDERPELSEEEQAYLDEYKAGIPPEGTGPYLESYLGTVARIAVEYTGRGVPLEDLIQEGNIGLMSAMEDIPEGTVQADEKRLIEAGIRKSLSAMLEETEQVKVTDEKIVNEINELVERIRQLAEELGYKPSVDEVSHYLDRKAEDIRRLLYLAGEEFEEETAEEEETQQEHVHSHHHEHGEACGCGHDHHHEHGEGCGCGHEHK